jgi:hypothetical protein
VTLEYPSSSDRILGEHRESAHLPQCTLLRTFRPDEHLVYSVPVHVHHFEAEPERFERVTPPGMMSLSTVIVAINAQLLRRQPL